MKILKSLFVILLAVTLMWNNSWLPKPTANADPADPLTVVLGTSVTTVATGATFTYTINYSYPTLIGSPIPAEIKLPLPQYVELAGGLPTSSVAALSLDNSDPAHPFVSIVFNGTGVAPGASGQFNINVRFKNYETPDGTIATAVCEHTVNGDPLTVYTSLPVNVTAQASSDWEVIKQKIRPIPQPIKGDEVEYEITIRDKATSSNGRLDISGVVVTDTLPPGATLVSADTPPNSVRDITDPTKVVWTFLNPGDPGYVPVRGSVKMKIKLLFPPSFVGPDATNTADLLYTPVGQAQKTATHSVTVTFASGPQDNGSGLNKNHIQSNSEVSPGQTVTFNIGGFDNNANQALAAGATIRDMTPVQTNQGDVINFLLEEIKTATFAGIADYEVWYTELENPGPLNWVKWGANVPAGTSTTLTVASLGGAVVKGIEYRFPTTLPINFIQTRNFDMTYRVDSSFNPGTFRKTLTNKAVLNYTFNGIAHSPVQPASTIAIVGNRPIISLVKTRPGSEANRKPGETITYTIKASNVGHSTAALYNPFITDSLPNELEYGDGDSATLVDWQLVHAPGGFAAPTFTLVDSLDPLNPTGKTLLKWEWSNSLPIGENVEIKFTARVKPGTPITNNVQNLVTLQAGDGTYLNDTNFNNAGCPGCTAPGGIWTIGQGVNINVVESVDLLSVMWVKGELDAAWKKMGHTIPGGAANYKLEISNVGNVNMDRLVIVNKLPLIGDTGVVSSGTRGSQWGPILTSPVTVPAAISNEVTVLYSTDGNVKMDNLTGAITGTFSSTPPSDLTSVTAIQLKFAPSFVFLPSSTFELEWTMRAPVGAPTGGEIAYNSFGYQVSKVGASTSLLPAEPNKVGIDIAPDNKGSIGNYVWLDRNENGVQDVGELGVNGMTVELYDAGTNTKLAGTLTGNDQNGQPGYYLFPNLDPGTYYVKFVTSPQYQKLTSNLQGGNTAKDSNADPITGKTANIPIIATETIDTIDAGLLPAALGDYVWDDKNNDGIQDVGEPGVSGVTVHLRDMNGVDITTTTTNATGFYEFKQLLPGVYSVKFDLPTPTASLSYMFAKQNAAGSTTANDSNANITDGTTVNVTLVPGETNSSIDTGLVRLASIGNFVWMDRNLDGKQDPSELGVNNVTVTLYDGAGVQVGVPTVTAPLSGVDGFYQFNNLVPGDYKVKFTLPAGYIFTTNNSSALGITTLNDSNADPAVGVNQGFTAVTTLDPDEHDNSFDAGLIKLVKLGDTLWVDTGVIGHQEGEPVLPVQNGIVVHLLDENGDPIQNSGVDVTTTTDALGKYVFNDLLPGKYRVKFDLPAGYLFTRKLLTGTGVTTATDSNVDSNGLTDVITLVAGEDDLTIDAGIVLPAALGDYVWNDNNSNGVQEAGETGRNGVTVELYNDSNALVGTTTTAANSGNDGYYSFTNLIPGSYKVKFIAPSGYMFSAKNSGSDVTKDSDAFASGFTDTVTLTPGQNNIDIDAGVHVIPASPVIPTASLGNYVWVDSNGNGIQDTGEKGLDGVTVELYDSSNTRIDLTITSGNGSYLFQNLNAGNYTVKFILPSGYRFSPSLSGTNRAVDSNASDDGRTAQVKLMPGDNNMTIDAGVVPLTTSLGDYVWIDKNKNGIQDASEVGQNGITVTLYNEAGVQIATTLTDNGSDGKPGYYEFKDLIPGKYSVKFDLPVGYVFTKKQAGSSVAVDSNADANGSTELIVLQPGERNLTVDAGLYLDVKPDPDKEPNKPGDKGNSGTGNGSTPGKGGVPGKDKPKGGGKSGTTGGKDSSGKGSNNGKDGKSALPKTGEQMPVLPIVGYALISAAILLLSVRWIVRKKQMKS
ncbi:SdrD B-like domain-containing protein [Cohnella silvisoli]|uniref:SdrD B-like domain-containing protein n=1 Tax=Cohnella silvisoli TaxID=2873699 RepID=A0ABV1KSM3_9BACL|nr:SdrD B-like domain-containing protein [Cohnella silvisoli]MCD9021271.1 DUF11 domain-containing protein [Cohnella silvisoli]